MTSLLQREFNRAYNYGCSGCDFDEAEGDICNHCDKCCKILAELIQKGARHTSGHDHLVSELKRRNFLPVSYT